MSRSAELIPASAARPPLRRLSDRSILPVCVLLLGLAATFAGSIAVYRSVEQQAQVAFVSDASLARAMLERRIASYLNVVRSTGQAFYLTPSPGPPTFYKYVEGLNLQENYPGIRGIGASVHIPADPAQKAKLLSQLKRYVPGYHFWPPGERADYHTVFAIFPRDKWNLRAIGYDMHSEPVRADAMDRARDGAAPAVSSRVLLVQDELDPKQPAFLIYSPLYSDGQIPATVQERRKKLMGHAYAPFRMREVFGDLFPDRSGSRVEFEVLDITGHDPGHANALVFQSWAPQSSTPVRPLSQPRFRRVENLRVGDRTWQISFLAGPAYLAGTGTPLVSLTALSGIAISFLVFGITLYQNRSQRALEERQRSIERLNGHLERAMRETHHRVKNNLQIISAMIDMQAMDASTAERLQLQRLTMHVRGLAMVHDLLTEQARLAGDGDFISAKAILQRLLPILEPLALGRPLVRNIEDASLSTRQGTSLAIVTNELVSNAIKHGKGPIEIRFSARDGAAELKVADDGPGFPSDFDPDRSYSTGLQLVESLSEWDLGGGVRFQNRPQGGAQVTVKLSLTKPQKKQKNLLTKRRDSEMMGVTKDLS